jgi:hypothetical protein
MSNRLHFFTVRCLSCGASLAIVDNKPIVDPPDYGCCGTPEKERWVDGVLLDEKGWGHGV